MQTPMFGTYLCMCWYQEASIFLLTFKLCLKPAIVVPPDCMIGPMRPVNSYSLVIWDSFRSVSLLKSLPEQSRSPCGTQTGFHPNKGHAGQHLCG